MAISTLDTTSKMSLCLPMSWLALAAIFFSVKSWAEPVPPGTPDGACWGNNQLSIEIKNGAFTSNEKGALYETTYQTIPSDYDGWCYSDSGEQRASYFRAELSQTLSRVDNDFFRLTEDIDMKIFVTGNSAPQSYVPFRDKFNAGATAGPSDDGVTPLRWANAGNQGKVTFRLRRKALSGAVYLPPSELFSFFRYSQPGRWSPQPLYTLSLKSPTILSVPATCDLNDGQNFLGLKIKEPIDSRKVLSIAVNNLMYGYNAGSKLTLRCDSGQLDPAKLSIGLIGSPGEKSGALATSNPGIDLVFYARSGSGVYIPLMPFQQTPLNGLATKGLLEIEVLVQKTSKPISTGTHAGYGVLTLTEY
ncbi:hypothetical protein M5G25_21285 [Pseudomonas sp. TNT2022 ID357]|uniref:Pilin (Type 1 fimbria component protein) n=1 Tax=Pseudomonas idahonensis TaxID=2942628 RepID=A0ABT5Q9W5_9PSED|nr:hypothetical protein [Pseudomonas idahonensis]MDD1150820.1 hypothetical protein [Pseudomonas idahonensis]